MYDFFHLVNMFSPLVHPLFSWAVRLITMHKIIFGWFSDETFGQEIPNLYSATLYDIDINFSMHYVKKRCKMTVILVYF